MQSCKIQLFQFTKFEKCNRLNFYTCSTNIRWHNINLKTNIYNQNIVEPSPTKDAEFKVLKSMTNLTYKIIDSYITKEKKNYEYYTRSKTVLI